MTSSGYTRANSRGYKQPVRAIRVARLKLLSINLLQGLEAGADISGPAEIEAYDAPRHNG